MMLKPALRPPLRAPMRGATTLREGGGVSLAAFMAAQADGLWFDTTKTDRFFQEIIGPTLADDVGEAVGLALDQRTWGNKTLAEIVSEQTEVITNGSFAVDANWMKTQATISGGVATVNSPDGTYAAVTQNITVAAGTYELTFDVVSVTSGSWAVSSSGISGGATLVNGSSTGTKKFYLTFATGGATDLQLKRNGGVTLFVVDNVSLKRVPGNHGAQASGSLKPIRQTTGAKFDGSDDNWLTTYSPAGTGAAFIVALLTGPTVVSGNHYAVGSLSGANDRFFMGVNNAGVFMAGVGAMVSEVGPDLRGVEVVCGITADGAGLATQFVDALAYTPFAYTGTLAGGALRIGALNNGGSASSYFGGSVKKLVVGREALTLAKYLQIRTQLLAA